MISTTSNNPLKTFLSFDDCSSVNFNFSVNSLRASIKLYIFCAFSSLSKGINTSLKASFTILTTFEAASNILFIDSSNKSLPDNLSMFS